MLLCRTVNTGYGLDYERLLADTDSRLFEQWRTLYSVEPWADERGDEAIGTLISYLAALNRVPPKAPRDYMERLKRPEKPQSEHEMKSVVDGIRRHLDQNPPR